VTLRIAPILVALLVLLVSDGWARSAAHPEGARRLSSLLAVEPPEGLAISEIQLAAPGRGEGSLLRLVQVGNPVRRPPPPDLSREGEKPFPGRLSLEVPPPGIGWGDSWLPPGIYRLSLHTDGLLVTLRAEPLATAGSIDLPVELGTMTGPGSRFEATLSRRTVEEEATGSLTIRWGALLIRARLSTPELRRTAEEDWTLAAVPRLVSSDDETYLGTLSGKVVGSGAMEARWVREASDDHRLRLELSRRRRFLEGSREAAARAGRLRTVAEQQAGAGQEERARRTRSLVQSLEEDAARLKSQAAALARTSIEVVGRARPATPGGDPEVRLDLREGKVFLVVEGPEGGAEFQLPDS